MTDRTIFTGPIRDRESSTGAEEEGAGSQLSQSCYKLSGKLSCGGPETQAVTASIVITML